MQLSLAGNMPLCQALWPATDARAKLARAVVLAVMGSALLWASAKVQIPFYPVPMTMQTYMVLVIGAAYGWRLGGATVLLYLLEGAAGLPVFAGTPEKGIGLAYLAGPTGGYLLGFLLAATLIGWLAQRGWDRSLWRMLVAMALGHGVIFLLGVGYLASLMGSLEQAVSAGFVPFAWATVLKTALAAATLPLAWQVLRRKP